MKTNILGDAAMKKILMFLVIIIIPVSYLSQDLNHAKKLLGDKKYRDAKEEFGNILKGNKNNHEAHFYLGQTLFYLKLFDEATEEFEEAISQNEKIADYHFGLAQACAAEALNSSIFSQLTLAGKIKNEYIKTLEIDNKHIMARVGLANYYLRAPGIMGGSIEKAYEQANILIKYDEMRGRYLLAQLYVKENKQTQAEEEYKILERKYGNQKDFYDFYNYYGYFLLNLGRKEEAIQKFKKQIELAPNNPNSYDSMGDVLLASGRNNEAIDHFKKALEIDPSFEASKKKLKKALNQNGKK